MKRKYMQPIDIYIWGRFFRVNCPSENIEDLKQAAFDLNQRLQSLKERTKVINNEELICIVALNISYELSQEKKNAKNNISNIEQRIKKLYFNIDKILIHI